MSGLPSLRTKFPNPGPSPGNSAKPLGKALGREEELRQVSLGQKPEGWMQKEGGGIKRWEPQWGGKEEEPRGGGEERRGLGRREEGAQVGRGRRGKSVGCGLISRKPDSTGHISQGNQSALQGPKLGGWGWRGVAKQAARHSQSTAGTPAESISPSPPWAQCRLELVPGWRAGGLVPTCPLPLRVWTSSG